MSSEATEAGIPPGFVALDWTLEPGQGFGGTVGPVFERREGANYARAFRVAPRHANGMGGCHGGMLMAFADLAIGHAVTIPEPRFWVTVRLTCDFLAIARIGDWVEGAGEIIARDSDLYTVRGKVWTGERLLMTATGIFKALDPPPGRI